MKGDENDETENNRHIWSTAAGSIYEDCCKQYEKFFSNHFSKIKKKERKEKKWTRNLN